MQRSQQKQVPTSTTGIARPTHRSVAGSRSALRRSSIGARIGFTLVELLVVIAIIGILIGMLAVSIGPVLTRVHDGAVSVELDQLELAIENFNNQYGFYPPSFGGLRNGVRDGGNYDLNTPWSTDGAVPQGEELQLLRFLNKIAPNHRENVTSPNFSGETPLRAWWVNIGRHLDDRSSLVFWLSGLTSNKQFPLTGGLDAVGGNAQLPVAFGLPQSIFLTGNGSPNTNADLAQDASGASVDIQRDNFFDFRGGQLAIAAVDIVTPTNSLPVDSRTSPNLAPGVRVYNTPYGDARPNRGNAYFYRDGLTYNVNGGAFYARNGATNGNNNSNVRFISPQTFQIYTFGQDGLANPAQPLNELDGPLGMINRDNISSFANGRLEVFDWRTDLGINP